MIILCEIVSRDTYVKLRPLQFNLFAVERIMYCSDCKFATLVAILNMQMRQMVLVVWDISSRDT